MTALSANITDVQTLIPVDAGLTNGSFELPLYYTVDSESIRVTGRAHRTTWLVERGIAGTTAASHSSAATLTRYYPEAAAGAGGGSLTFDNIVDPPAEVTTLIAAGADVSTPGTATIRPVIVSEDDPGTIGMGFLWLHKAADGNSYQLYVRNDNNDGWEQASAGLGDADSDLASRQVGWYDTAQGTFIGLEVISLDRRIEIGTWSEDANDTTKLLITPTAIRISGLPTADPTVANALWIDTAAGRVLKVSAG